MLTEVLTCTETKGSAGRSPSGPPPRALLGNSGLVTIALQQCYLAQSGFPAQHHEKTWGTCAFGFCSVVEVLFGLV